VIVLISSRHATILLHPVHRDYGFASGRSGVPALSCLRERVCHHPAITATSSATKPAIALPPLRIEPLLRIGYPAVFKQLISNL